VLKSHLFSPSTKSSRSGLNTKRNHPGFSLCSSQGWSPTPSSNSRCASAYSLSFPSKPSGSHGLKSMYKKNPAFLSPLVRITRPKFNKQRRPTRPKQSSHQPPASSLQHTPSHQPASRGTSLRNSSQKPGSRGSPCRSQQTSRMDCGSGCWLLAI